MKKLPPPRINDNKITTALSENSKLSGTSYPHLKKQLSEVLDSYAAYHNLNGDALNISPIKISTDLKRGLRSNYKSPPHELSHIAIIRDSSSDICPMCGMPGNGGTIDHLLPKERYPEFSILSKNLVPACLCNITRGTSTIAPNGRARVLHPYYDSCLTTRLLSCEIKPSPRMPKVEIRERYLTETDPIFESVKFHVINVVLRAGLIKTLESKWVALVNRPLNVIATLPLTPVTSEFSFTQYLEDCLARHDESLGTPNNWYSIFVHGLINSPGVLTWLRERHNDSCTNPGQTLV